MRKIKEVLRLRWACGLSQRQIAESCSIARSTVGEYLLRAQAAGLEWPLPEELDEAQLEAMLFPLREGREARSQPLPDWAEVHRELKRKGVTLSLLWMEYKAQHPEGYQYSRFCDRYRNWAKTIDPCMRQDHKAGEKLFVDYCGLTVPVVDRATGETYQAQVFVAALGASNYTYAEATQTQSLPDWIGSHVRALRFFGGAPELLVPDNVKVGITHACRYEPDLNPTYQEMAAHYGVTVLPTRVCKPKDKAKVEKAVQIVEQWILAPLRHRTFFSVGELNQAIREGVEALNERPFQKFPGTRKDLFETLEQPVLNSLPTEPYTYADWKKARVHIDYHVEVDGHYYSVPYRYIHRPVEIRLTARTVECFYRGTRIASHARSVQQGGHTTILEHMPKSHREYLDWPPDRLIGWAKEIGPSTAQVVTALLERRSHPAQAYRSCLGILRLGKEYGTERLEKACKRAYTIRALAYKSIRSILKNGLDRLPLPEPPPSSPPLNHENIRGAHYFNNSQKEMIRC